MNSKPNGIHVHLPIPLIDTFACSLSRRTWHEIPFCHSHITLSNACPWFWEETSWVQWRMKATSGNPVTQPQSLGISHVNLAQQYQQKNNASPFTGRNDRHVDGSSHQPSFIFTSNVNFDNDNNHFLLRFFLSVSPGLFFILIFYSDICMVWRNLNIFNKILIESFNDNITNGL